MDNLLALDETKMENLDNQQASEELFDNEKSVPSKSSFESQTLSKPTSSIMASFVDVDEELAEDIQGIDALPNAKKHIAYCHMPIVLKKSLDPLRALYIASVTSTKRRINKLDSLDDTVTEGTDDSKPVYQESNMPKQETHFSVSEENLLNTKFLERLSVPEENEVLSKCIEEKATSIGTLNNLSHDLLTMLEQILRDSRRSNKATRLIEITKTLINLLIESKEYIHSDLFPSNLILTSKQPPLTNHRQLKRILPLKSYNLVAPILNMPYDYPLRSSRKTEKVQAFKEENKDDSDAEAELDLESSGLIVRYFLLITNILF